VGGPPEPGAQKRAGARVPGAVAAAESVINKAAFRRFLLRRAAEKGRVVGGKMVGGVLVGGRPKFKSVSSATLQLADRALREWGDRLISATPSNGKTL